MDIRLMRGHLVPGHTANAEESARSVTNEVTRRSG